MATADVMSQAVCKRLIDEYKKYDELAKDADEKNDDLASLIRYIAVASLAEVLKDSCGDVAGMDDKYKQHISKVNEHLSSVSRRLQSGGDAGEADSFSCENVVNVTISNEETVTFDQIVGFDDVKKELTNSVLMPLKYPNLFPSLPKGILLYGLPGTGKTYFVRALIKELSNAKDLNVLFFAPTGAELKGKYVGETEKRISAVFNCASKSAYDCACVGDNDGKKKRVLSVIFIDEVESIARDRTADETGLMANSVNMLLQKMDGVESNQNVLVVAATNFPWDLDSAVLRRFTKQIPVRLPDANLIQSLITKELARYRNRSVSMKHLECQTTDKKKEKKGKSCHTFVGKVDSGANANREDTTPKKEDYIELAIELKAANFSNSDVKRLIDMACFTAAKNALDANRFSKESTLSSAVEYHANNEGEYRLQGGHSQVELDGRKYVDDRTEVIKQLDIFYPKPTATIVASLCSYIWKGVCQIPKEQRVKEFAVLADKCYHSFEKNNILLQFNMARRMLLIDIGKGKKCTVRFYVSDNNGGDAGYFGKIGLLDITGIIHGYMRKHENRLLNIYDAVTDATYKDTRSNDIKNLEKGDIGDIMQDVFKALLVSSHVPSEALTNSNTDSTYEIHESSSENLLDAMLAEMSSIGVPATICEFSHLTSSEGSKIIEDEYESNVYNLKVTEHQFTAAMKGVRSSIRKSEMDEIEKYIKDPSTYTKKER
jgi:SpoVK/Ycf46/Vps4 family AAA+-type ATPase